MTSKRSCLEKCCGMRNPEGVRGGEDTEWAEKDERFGGEGRVGVLH